MVCIGFGQGISPIVSICWGAKEKETATKIRSITNRILLAIGTLTALSFFVAGKRYAEIFGCSNSIADMVATGFRIYAITFLAMAPCILQAVAMQNIWIFLRQITAGAANRW